MSLPNQISKTRLTPMLAVVGVCLAIMTSGCCGIYGGGCGVGAYGHGPIADAGYGGGYDAGCDSGCCGPGGVGPGACGNCSGLRNLLSPLLHPRLACGSGCGEIYWNEWACDPPDCCDPCDGAGCYVGPRTCYGPPLIASAIHCVGRGVSDLLGAILGGIGCGPCAILNCGGCGSCGACDGGVTISGGHGGCAGGCAGGCSSCGNGLGETIIDEGPQVQHLGVAPSRGQPIRSATQQIRATHGRSPHRTFSQRIR